MLSEMKQLWIGHMGGFYWSGVHVGKVINEESNYSVYYVHVDVGASQEKEED